MKRPSFGQADEAVSVVIGAILVAAVLFATVAFVRVAYVPVWEERAEAGHMDAVERQLSDIKTDLDERVDNRSRVATTHPIDLATSRDSLTAPTVRNGQLSFTAGSAPMTLSSSGLVIYERDGASLAGVNESWSPVGTSLAYAGLSGLDHLRVRLASVSALHTGDSLAATIQDATGAFAGDITVSVTSRAVGYDIDMSVRNATGAVVAHTALASAQQSTRTPYWVDLLHAEPQVLQVLHAAPAPWTLTLSVANVNSGAGDLNLTADHAIAYRVASASGPITQGGTGLALRPYNVSFAGGTLSYVARNIRYPEQTYTLENGALFLTQPDGTVLRTEPTFDVSRVGNITAIRMSVPSLTGATATTSGSGSVGVLTSTTSATGLRAAAPDWTVEVASAHPDQWARVWADKLGAVAGLTNGTHYVITSNATHARLTVYGLTSTPGSTALDLFITLQQASVRTEVRP